MTRRSALAHDNERTLLAWIRTAVVLFAIGCVVAQLGTLFEQDGRGHAGAAATRAPAVALLIVATLTALLGLDDFRRRRSALEASHGLRDDDARSPALCSLTILVGIVGVSLVVLMALWR